MIEIDEASYILGYWFSSDQNNNCWYLMMTRKENGEWLGQATFRTNKSDDPFSGEDNKKIYKIVASSEKTEEEILTTCEYLFEKSKILFNDYSDSFLVRGNSQKFMNIAKTKHYLHFKETN